MHLPRRLQIIQSSLNFKVILLQKLDATEPAKSLGVFATGLNSTRQLRILNLNNNLIGSTGPSGPQYLLSILPHLPILDTDQLNLNGMTNISWSESFSTLQHLRSQELTAKCQVDRCFGGGIDDHGISTKEGDIRKYLDEQYKQQSTFTIYSSQAPQLTSSATSPSDFLKETTRSLSEVYRMFQTLFDHPDVQTAGLVMIGTKLACASLQAWPLLVTTYLAIV